MINKTEFEALYYDGYSPVQIAEVLGVKYASVWWYMNHNVYPRICPKNDQIIREMCEEGAKDIEIAMKTNLTIGQIRKYIDERRITRRQKRDYSKSKKQATRTTHIKNSNVMKYCELYSQGCDDKEIAGKGWRQTIYCNELARKKQSS